MKELAEHLDGTLFSSVERVAYGSGDTAMDLCGALQVLAWLVEATQSSGALSLPETLDGYYGIGLSSEMLIGTRIGELADELYKKIE